MARGPTWDWAGKGGYAVTLGALGSFVVCIQGMHCMLMPVHAAKQRPMLSPMQIGALL